MLLYPIAVVVILLGLAWAWVRDRPAVARWVVACTGLAAFFDLLGALPEALATTPPVTALTGLAGRVLPGYAVGFGWVVPALVGLVVGTLAAASRPRSRRGEREAIPVTAGHGRTAAD